MSIFEVVFNLVGLVLGFALIEVLAGLARIMHEYPNGRPGLPTPLLAVFMLLDITSFWGSAWELRTDLPDVWQSLGAGIALTSIYYLAASQVFPARITSGASLDAHYWSRRRLVGALVLACNAFTMMSGLLLGRHWSPTVTAINVAYLSGMLAFVIVGGRRTNVSILLVLIAIQIWSFATPSGA